MVGSVVSVSIPLEPVPLATVIIPVEAATLKSLAGGFAFESYPDFVTLIEVYVKVKQHPELLPLAGSMSGSVVVSVPN